MNSLIIASNVIKRLIKNRIETVIVIVLPILLIAALVIMSGGQGGSTSIGLVMEDGDFASVWLRDKLTQESGFDTILTGVADYHTKVQENQLVMAIVIPGDLAGKILSGEENTISVYAKSQSMATANLSQQTNQYLSSMYAAAETAKQLSSVDGKDVSVHFEKLLDDIRTETVGMIRSNPLSQPASKDMSLVITSVGFIIMFMMVLIFITMGTIQEDRRKLTLARMFVMPVKEWEIILGNILGSLFLGVLQAVPIIVVLGWVHQLSWSQMTGIFLVLLFFLLAAVGLGISLSGLIRGNFDPITIIAAVITPTCILGGCFIPESMLPDVINKAGYIVPQKWAIGAITQLLNGAGIEKILMNLAILLLFSLVLATFGLKTIRPMKE